MLKSNAPAIITVPFASGAGAGYIRPVPIPSQISITPGAASWTDGFPPLTMTPSGAGGIPPFGQDMNGLLNAETLNMQWKQLGFDYAWSSSVSTAIGGYPSGARLLRSDGLGYWLNLADSNTTNPDATGATNWVAQRVNGGQSTIVVSSGTYTPDPSVLGVPLLVLSGTLTANVTVVLPLTRSGATWRIYNATTGAFTVNVQGATGSGVTASQGQLTDVTTDGTNYYSAGLSGGPYLPLSGTAVAAAKLASARTIAMTGPVTWSVSFDGSANVTAAATIAAGAVGLSNLAALTASTLLGNPTTSAATPVAIPLVNGIVFSGGSLGLGAITPTSVNTTGNVTSNGIFLSNNNTVIVAASGAAGGQIVLRPNGSGSATGQVTFDASGNVVTPGNITAGSNLTGSTNILSSTAFWVASGNATSSNVSFYFRPGGATVSTLQTQMDTGGNWNFGANINVASTVTFNGIVQSSTTTCILAPTGAGAVYLRPNGSSSATGQLVVDSGGNVTISGQVSANFVLAGGGNFQSSGAEMDLSLSYNGSANNGFYISASSGVMGFNTRNSSAAYLGTPLQLFTSGTYAAQVNGSLQVTGTINFNTSDATLKNLGEPIEPQPFHRLPYYAYTRKDTGQKGWGPTAQDARELMPDYVQEYDHRVEGSKETVRKLTMAGQQMTQDTAYWAARQVDLLWDEVRRLRDLVQPTVN